MRCGKDNSACLAPSLSQCAVCGKKWQAVTASRQVSRAKGLRGGAVVGGCSCTTISRLRHLLHGTRQAPCSMPPRSRMAAARSCTAVCLSAAFTLLPPSQCASCTYTYTRCTSPASSLPAVHTHAHIYIDSAHTHAARPLLTPRALRLAPFVGVPTVFGMLLRRTSCPAGHRRCQRPSSGQSVVCVRLSPPSADPFAPPHPDRACVSMRARITHVPTPCRTRISHRPPLGGGCGCSGSPKGGAHARTRQE